MVMGILSSHMQKKMSLGNFIKLLTRECKSINNLVIRIETTKYIEDDQKESAKDRVPYMFKALNSIPHSNLAHQHCQM